MTTPTDTERLDWLDKVISEGSCPGLINDDCGRWAVSHDGMQSISLKMLTEPCDVHTTFFITADKWRNSVREAIDAAILSYEIGDDE